MSTSLSRLAPVRNGRRAGDERGQLASGAPERALVQQVAAREHESHDEPCRQLAQGERPAHGQQSDDVGAQLAAQHAAPDLERERDDHRDQHDRPQNVRRVRLAREDQGDANRQRERDGHRNESCSHMRSVHERGPWRIGASRRVDA